MKGLCWITQDSEQWIMRYRFVFKYALEFGAYVTKGTINEFQCWDDAIVQEYANTKPKGVNLVDFRKDRYCNNFSLTSCSVKNTPGITEFGIGIIYNSYPKIFTAPCSTLKDISVYDLCQPIFSLPIFTAVFYAKASQETPLTQLANDLNSCPSCLENYIRSNLTNPCFSVDNTDYFKQFELPEKFFIRYY